MAKVLCPVLHQDVLGAGQGRGSRLGLYGKAPHAFDIRAQVWEACVELHRTQHSPAWASSLRVAAADEIIRAVAHRKPPSQTSCSKITAESIVQAAVAC